MDSADERHVDQVLVVNDDVDRLFRVLRVHPKCNDGFAPAFGTKIEFMETMVAGVLRVHVDVDRTRVDGHVGAHLSFSSTDFTHELKKFLFLTSCRYFVSSFARPSTIASSSVSTKRRSI